MNVSLSMSCDGTHRYYVNIYLPNYTYSIDKEGRLVIIICSWKVYLIIFMKQQRFLVTRDALQLGHNNIQSFSQYHK
jgi:hypothetical protein